MAVVLIKLFVFTILPGISSDGINLLENYVNKVNIFILFLISVDNFLFRQCTMSGAIMKLLLIALIYKKILVYFHQSKRSHAHSVLLYFI